MRVIFMGDSFFKITVTDTNIVIVVKNNHKNPIYSGLSHPFLSKESDQIIPFQIFKFRYS